MDRHLSPAELAKRFGVSVKALRLYERRGLLKPLRTTNGTSGVAWRVYGADQVARLHQILALKRLGLSLARIGELLVGEDELEPILALQERVLVEEGERITRALTLIRKARAKLASGQTLSIDDLATLTQETVMTRRPAVEELKETMAPFRQKHLSPEDVGGMKEWRSGHPDMVNALQELVEEANALMAAGEDATSPSAMTWARRYLARCQPLLSGQPSFLTDVKPKMKAMLADARSDPKVAQKIEVVGFIEKAVENLKAQDGN